MLTITQRRRLHSIPARGHAPEAVPGSRDFLTSGGVESRHAQGLKRAHRGQIGRPACGQAGFAPGPLTHESGGALGLGLLYAAVWLVTYAIAHSRPGLAFGVATAFVLIPGVYILAGIRIARVAQMLHRP